MKQSLADKLEAFVVDATNAMPNGPYLFLRQTLGGCVQRNIGEIVAALRERDARFESGHSDPSPEQEVGHLAEQCATLLAENEALRASRGWPVQEYEAVRNACQEERAENERLRAWAAETKIGIDDLKAQNERLRAALENARRDLNGVCVWSEISAARKSRIEAAAARIEAALNIQQRASE